MKELLLIETIRKKKIHWRTREKAIKAIIRLDKEGKYDFENSSYLIRSFLWRNTPEGFNFWDNIDDAKDKEER